MPEPVVFGLDGSVHDMAWLRNEIAAPNLAYHAPAGWPAFELKAVFMTSGATNLWFTVKREDGSPALGQPVWYSFPSLENPAADLQSLVPGDKSAWTRRGVVGRCDFEGKQAFQIGGESWVNQVDGCGPYSVGVISPSVYSACLSGIGWKGHTNHDGPCSFLFQLQAAAPGGDDGGGDDGGGDDGGGEPPPAGDLAGLSAEVRRVALALERLAGHLGA